MQGRGARAGLLVVTAILLTSSVLAGLTPRAGASNGAGRFQPPLGFWAQDTDGDGLYDWLWVNASLDVTVQGAFSFDLTLRDATNTTTIATPFNATYLFPGLRTVSLGVDGFALREGGVSGPFVATLGIRNARGVLVASSSASSPPYLAGEFQRSPAVAASPFGDGGTDADVPQDGEFNEFHFRANVTFSAPGLYVLIGSLFPVSPPISPIAFATREVRAGVGVTTVGFSLSGMTIRAAGRDGPYTEAVQVVAGTSWGSSLVVSQSLGTSAPYLATDFQSRAPQPVHGRVVDDRGAPVAGAYVRFFNGRDLYMNSTQTDASGNYTMDAYNGTFVTYATDADHLDDLVNRTIAGPGPFDFTVPRAPTESIEATAAMSSPDHLRVTSAISLTDMAIDDRMAIDWLLGDRDGWVSPDEQAGFVMVLGAPRGTLFDDTEGALTLDDVFFYPSDPGGGTTGYDFTGSVYSNLPLHYVTSVRYAANRTIPSQPTHLLNISGAYNAVHNSTATILLPPGWLATAVDPIQNVSVTGLGTGTVLVVPGGNPGGVPDTFQVNLTITDTGQFRPVVSDVVGTPDPQEFMQPVLLSATVTSGRPITSVKVAVVAPSAGLLGNFTMTFNPASGKYEYPLASYPELGTYALTVWATDDVGNTSSGGGTFRVRDTTSPVAAAGPDRTVVVGGTVAFDGRDSTDNVGVVNWTWTFNDGTSAATLYGAIPTHRFDTTGAYPVTLTVRDPSGNTGTDTMTVTVVPPPTPGPPTGVAATQTGAGRVLVTWAAPTVNTDGSPIAGPLTYAVYRSDAAGGPYGLVNATVSGTTFVDTSVPTGTHYYAVVAVNQWGKSSVRSDPAAVTVTDRGRIVGVVTGGRQPLQSALVEVLDASGQVVANAATAANGTFVVSDLAPGSYTVRASKEGYESKQVPATVPPYTQTDVGVIDLAATVPQGEFPWMWVAAIVVVIALVLSLLAVLVRKRRKAARAREATSPPEDRESPPKERT